MKNFGLILMCICMTALIAAGCNKETKTSGGGPGAEAMKQFCNKGTKESAAASGQEMTSDAQSQMAQMCEKDGGMFKSNDKALEAFANHILNTCEGKIGKDWMDCYTQELPVAQQKAADAAR